MVEETGLTARPFLLAPLGRIDDSFIVFHQLASSIAKGIKNPAFDDAFNHPLINFPEIDTVAEIVESRKFPLLFPYRYDRVNRTYPHVLDGSKTEANMLACNTEIALRFIDIGREHIYAHILAAVYVLDDLVPVVLFACEQGGHEFNGKISFQISGLVGYHGVSGAVGLVESVFCKCLHLLPDFSGLLFGYISVPRTFEKFRSLFLHLRWFFLAHELAQYISFSHSIAADGARYLHYLFLVYDDAICLFQYLFQRRYFINNLCLTLFARDKFRNHIHWPRSVQGNQGDYFLNAVRLHIYEDILHAGTFQLKYAVCITLH